MKRYNRNLTKIENDILELCSIRWFENPAGIDAISLEHKLKLSNKEIMKYMESLVQKGLGKINANVKLFSLSLDNLQNDKGLSGKEIVTHIYFPPKEVLSFFYYLSDLSKQDIPEYNKRLHLGGDQIELLFFENEVLNKYIEHPEKYKIDDNLSGGNIYTIIDCDDRDYIHVRYGKKLINNGDTAITTILSDLSMMSDNEQKYWSSFEISKCYLDPIDHNFSLFLEKTYDGKRVKYENPIKDISIILTKFNKTFGDKPLFKKTHNIHLNIPVVNTHKSFSDSCSELYKLVGPDNIDIKILENYMIKYYEFKTQDFKHQQSGKNLSSLQLIQLFEEKLKKNSAFFDIISEIKQYRIDADHRIINELINNDETNYPDKFKAVCCKYISISNELFELLQ